MGAVRRTNTLTSVQTFGAKGDGTTDDTAAFVAAIATGKSLFVPEGTYIVDTDSLVLNTNGQTLFGAGQALSIIQTADTEGAIVTISADYCGLENLRLRRSTTGTAGANLLVEDGNGPVVRACHFSGGFDAIATESSSTLKLSDCTIFDFVRYGVLLENTDSPDSGDQGIFNCVIDSNVCQAVSACIRQESAGGLKLIGNKILGESSAPPSYGLDVQIDDGVTTVDLLVVGNSFENLGTSAIRVGRSGTTGALTKVVISGNQIHSLTDDTAVTLAAGTGTGVFSNNVLTSSGGSSSTGVNITGGQRWTVGSNYFGSYNTAIRVAFGTYQVGVDSTNKYVDCSFGVENNQSPSTSQFLPVRYASTRKLSTSSDSTYTDLWEIDPGNYRSCVVTVIADLLLNGVGGGARTVQKLLARHGTTDTEEVTAVVVSDISDVASSGGAGCDIQFDTATTTGVVRVGLKKSSSSGSSLVGPVTLLVDGNFKTVEEL